MLAFSQPFQFLRGDSGVFKSLKPNNETTYNRRQRNNRRNRGRDEPSKENCQFINRKEMKTSDHYFCEKATPDKDYGKKQKQ
jgi:hypothetical protein